MGSASRPGRGGRGARVPQGLDWGVGTGEAGCGCSARGIRHRSSPDFPGCGRTWSQQSAARSEGAAPPGQRGGGLAPRGAPPPMMRRPPTGPRPVTHSSPWLQHKATSPGGRFLPEERLRRPRRRRRRKRRGRGGGRGSPDAWRGCALRSRPRARRGPAPGSPCPPAARTTHKVA